MSARGAAELLRSAQERLTASGVLSPRADAEQLLAHVLEVDRLWARWGDPTPEQVARFTALVDRRAAREPLQHLLGTAGFRRVELAVGPGVFVPRPETEVLAGWAVEQVSARIGECSEPVVVDLCTGSGAIAAAVADEAPDARVHAVELASEAFAYAERNLLGAGVDLRLGDIADAFVDLDGTVDVVTANPPYIPLSAWESVAPEARDHDPAIALWAGVDGLDAIRAVEMVASRLLRPGGVVGCEHADVQGQAASSVFAGTGRWVEVMDHDDLTGRPRFVTARRARNATSAHHDDTMTS
ncbi:MAG: peptide chain release factor N(5)-glutamine methyltransferase [Nocardioidaceae bacterium]